MKTICSILLLAVISIGFSQDFKTSLESAVSVPASYFGASSNGVITENDLFIHARDVVEVLDLKSNTVLHSWDPDGGSGTSWVSSNGKFVANHSQNAKGPDGWVDAFHVQNLSTKKVYTKYTPDGYWDNPAFGQVDGEILVRSYNAETGSNKALLYDFISGKTISTIFTSTKFSTVIMSMAFSADGSKIYAVIATNSTNSSLHVYDKESGSLIKKISLSFQADKIFPTNDYIFCSGAHGGTGKDYTAKISAADYVKKAEWEFRIGNIDPSGNYSLIREWKSDFLSKIDLNTGAKTDMLNVSTLAQFEWVNGISTDGRYFFSSIKREGVYKEQGGKPAFLVFKNDLIDVVPEIDLTPETSEETVEEVLEESAWIDYNSAMPKFSIGFPEAPTVKNSENSKGRYKQSLKRSANDFAYLVNLEELSPKIKSSKYFDIADKVASSFIAKMEATNSNKSEFTVNDQKGIEYTFTKKKVYYRYRSICIEGVSYQIIFLNSTGNGDKGDRFFDSFEITTE